LNIAELMKLKFIVFAAGLALVTIGAVGAWAASICLPPSPLPSAPSAGAQSVAFTGLASASASYSAILWREACLSNPATSALYLRVTPPPGGTVVLGALFVIQNGMQRNAYMYQGSGDIPLLPFAGLIVAPTTVLIESPPELTGSHAFDPNLPTTLVIYFGPSASLPAYGAAGAADATAPTIPGVVAATAVSSSQVSLKWAPSTDEAGGSGLAGYKIERCNGASCTRFSQIDIVTASTYSDYGLNPGTAYTYRVRAYDNVGNNSGYSALAAATTLAADGSTMTIATEFYHPGFDHYFITANAAEAASLIAGNLAPWIPTGNTFWVWTGAHTDVTPVCRFFSATFAPKSGHFYSNTPGECPGLQAGGVWVLEDSAAFYLMTSATGLCPTASTPLYRLYNDGQGGAPNHRYTIDPGIRRSMLAAHWISEGNGPDGVFACVPDDGSVGYQQTAQLIGGTWSFDFVRDGVASTDTFSFTGVRANTDPSLPWAADGTSQIGRSISALYSVVGRNLVLSSQIDAAGSDSFPRDYFEFSYTDDNTVTGCYHYYASLSSSIGPCTPFAGSRAPVPIGHAPGAYDRFVAP
jgi:hypothetical protein